MKKLMVAAAAAAMIGGAYAMDAQVYDFSASLKTTACKETKVSSALAKYFNTRSYKDLELYEKGDKIGLRKQASRKLVGVIWGCDCPTLITPPAWSVYNDKTLGGYMFWDQSVDDYFRVRKTSFSWNVLNRIDAMTKCEGSFTLRNWAQGQSLFLVGAGFGTVKGRDCSTYVKSMNGSLVGYREPNEGDTIGCVFCDVNGCVVDPICDVCFVGELGVYNPDVTIAYGTWKIKFNSSVAKKLATKGRLSQVYKFKKAGNAKDVLAFLETYVPGNSIAKDADDYEEGEEMIDEDEEIERIEDGDTLVDTAEANYEGSLPTYIEAEDNAEDNEDFIEDPS
jgi:hypothetical protein